MKDQLKIT